MAGVGGLSGEKGLVLYIDHSFHVQSKSTAFFPYALSEAVEVVEIWDDSWKGAAPISYEDVSDLNASHAVFFQTFPTPKFLNRFKGPIVVIPMYDGPAPSWLMPLMAAYHVSVVAFSKAVEEQYRRFGMKIIPLTYAPSVIKRPDREGSLNLFFWERGPIRWSDVKRLLGNQKFGTIYLKLNPDPGFESSEISAEDRNNYEIVVIEGWIEKDEYQRILENCDLYVAPRISEGIGMSFLEAMATGLAVVAVDRPTMNEYITDRESGYLFKLPVEGPIDFSDARHIGAQGRAKIESLEESFNSALPRVVSEILSLDFRQPNAWSISVWRIKERAGRLSRKLRKLTYGVLSV